VIRTSRSAAARWCTDAEIVCTSGVHGACVGAGMELPAFSSRVVASPDATFRLPEVGMGLVPGAGGTASIPRRVGRGARRVARVDRLLRSTPRPHSLGPVDEIETPSGPRV